MPATITTNNLAARKSMIKTVDQKPRISYNSSIVNKQPRRAYEKVNYVSSGRGYELVTQALEVAKLKEGDE